MISTTYSVSERLMSFVLFLGALNNMHTLGAEIESDRWFRDLKIKDPEKTSVVYKNAENKIAGIVLWKDFNILFGDKSSIFFLCFGGPSTREAENLWKSGPHHWPVYRRVGNYQAIKLQKFKYLGDFTPIAETRERRTLGFISSLMHEMRQPNGKPYELKRVLIMVKETLGWQTDVAHYVQQELIFEPKASRKNNFHRPV